MRLRFAPSPTGTLHLGNARTALFNYLLAAHHHSTLILRIEDTDQERSTHVSEVSIIEDLRWLGITWNEGPDQGGPHGPYRQSESLHHYQAALAKLRAKHAAYPCFCTKEQLDQEREEQIANKMAPRYLGRCRHLSINEVEEKLRQQLPHVWRLRYPSDDTTVTFYDLVRGEVSFQVGHLGGDLVLCRANGWPLFHFAVVVDDARMGVSHVLRGEDHLTNTAKQLLIYEALDETPPQFGHMAMILGTDKTKLSKRHGAVNVAQYREKGVLPQALFNYLSLLGWSTGDETEIMTSQEIIARFSIDRIIKSAAVFDEAKLFWMNGLHIRQLTAQDFTNTALSWLRVHDLQLIEQIGEGALTNILPVVQDAIQVFTDLRQVLQPFYQHEFENNAEIEAVLAFETLPPIIHAIETRIDQIGKNTTANDTLFTEFIDAIKKETKANGRKLFQPVRLILTGKVHGPELKLLFGHLPIALIRKRIDDLKTRLQQ